MRSREDSTRKPAAHVRRPQTSAAATASAAGRLVDWFRDFAKRPYARTVFVGGMLGVVMLVIVGRLIQLQTVLTGTYATKAFNELTLRRTLYHRRGAIYDRNGVVLARSVDAVNIALHPYLVKDVNATANFIVSVLGGDAVTVAGRIHDNVEADVPYIYLQKQADTELSARFKSELAALNVQRKKDGLDELVGFEYEDTSKRMYPMGNIAGTVVGCVGDDGVGRTGLELQYDDDLSGTDGSLVEERGKNGTPVVGGYSERIDPVDGESVVISIDVEIQKVAQEAIAAAVEEWGATGAMAVVMVPKTGELLACCSTPYLDPSDLSTASSEQTVLKCVSDSYEPGSTVKPLTAAMAVDLGISGPDYVYDVPATIQVGDDVVGDVDDRDYDANFTLTNILERSSNVGAVLCAEGVGARNFSEYLDRFQIGHKTGVDYPGEAVGLVSSYEQYTGAWASMAFGQGLAVPPLQMARAVGAIANGGVLATPHFRLSVGGEEIDWGEGSPAVSEQTASTVAWMMNSVTVNGYGKPAAIDGYNISSKTGTAECADNVNGGYRTDRYLVSFIGFAPTEDPKALVYVLVDGAPFGGTGSTVAAPPWRTIMAETLDRLQVSPSW
jgi:cell division protein FtsI (penicillin-binding protein 3)